MLIETALGMANVEAIAQSSRRLEAMHFGVADYAASCRARTVSIGGLNPDYPGDQWHAALSRMVVACRAYGLRAIDGPFGDFKDPEGYTLRRAPRRRARHRGEVGDPSQPDRAGEPGVHPAARRRWIGPGGSWWRWRRPRAKGGAPPSSTGRMIDAASARMAQNVVSMAEAIGQRNGGTTARR